MKRQSVDPIERNCREYLKIVSKLAEEDKRAINWFLAQSHQDRRKFMEYLEEDQFWACLIQERAIEMLEWMKELKEKEIRSRGKANSYLSELITLYIDGKEKEASARYEMLTNEEKQNFYCILKNTIAYHEKMEHIFNTAIKICDKYHIS